MAMVGRMTATRLRPPSALFLFLIFIVLIIPVVPSQQDTTIESTDQTCTNADDETCTATSRKDTIDDECVDKNTMCLKWAEQGECFGDRKELMEIDCRQSCEFCTTGNVKNLVALIPEDLGCRDMHPKCGEWAQLGECLENPGYMLNACKLSCQKCMNSLQLREDGASDEDILALYRYIHRKSGIDQPLAGNDSEKIKLKSTLLSMHRYARENSTKLSLEERLLCTNQHENCAFWASVGECEENIVFMLSECSLACQVCHLKKKFQDCKRGDVTATWLRGTYLWETHRKMLQEGFESAIASRMKRDDDPWVLKMDDFLSEEECDSLLAQPLDWKPSSPVAVKNSVTDDTFVRRQGQTALCENEVNCGAARSLRDKIISFLGAPSASVEPLEFVHYELFQSFGVHHDFTNHDLWMPAGPRIFTIFVTLNHVEEGGAMGFPDLDWTLIPPKKGQILIWPNTMRTDTTKPMPKMMSEGLPTRKGEKYGVYAYVRLFDYEEARARSCI